jgi:pyridinium-3,5-biscarboxylic acid mononucleotide sulfurtransferase
MLESAPLDDPTAIERRERRLFAILSGLGRVAVAFSGGVDSSYLLAAAIDALGRDRVVALTADSPLLPRAERDTAVEVAQLLDAEHRLIPFDDLAIAGVVENSPQRCYHCKRARFEALRALAAETDGAVLVHGENVDDADDYRPGAVAARELGVRAPLAEAGLTKADIRALSRRRGLPTWDHPAAACLASRFPYGTPLTREGLERVERAERALQVVTGLRQVRVRDHHPVARIEVPPDDIARLAAPDMRQRVHDEVMAAGYRYVALDLLGYRTGSLNEGIEKSGG